MKTHGYLTIDNQGTGFVTETPPQFDRKSDGSVVIFDETGVPFTSELVSPDAVERLFGERGVPEAPADKYPCGRTYIVKLEELNGT
tara:strand:+ start:576 stop:833 length:258 start_codon:yes stop_codon:yes gene_type:complete